MPATQMLSWYMLINIDELPQHITITCFYKSQRLEESACDALSNPSEPTELIIIKEVHSNIICMPAESFCWVFYKKKTN